MTKIVRYAAATALAHLLLLLTACGDSSPSVVTPPQQMRPQIPPDVPAQAGTVKNYEYAGVAGNYPYQVYIPPGYTKGTAWPLYVNVHGCGTTADQHMQSTLLNAVADASHFIVVYPDTMPSGLCWRAFLGDQTSKHRGLGGDADVLAGVTKEVIGRYTIDLERVYLMGMSSGGFQASVMGAAYPDLYAAVGVNAGGAYGQDATCITQTDDVVPAYALMAQQEMGTRARFMPFIAIGGDNGDPLGETPAPGGCTRMAFKQWMLTNNLIAGASAMPQLGGPAAPFSLDPQSTVQGNQPFGYAWTKEVFRDRSGCEIGEHYVVHGMAHFWSGGTADPKYATFVDPKGPSTSQLSWEFFRRFTKSGTVLPCVETR